MVSGRARGSEATAAREEEEVRWAAAGGREGPAAAVRGGAGGSDGGRWLHLRSSVAAPEGCNASRDDFQRPKRGEGEAPVGTAARDPKSLSLSSLLFSSPARQRAWRWRCVGSVQRWEASGAGGGVGGVKNDNGGGGGSVRVVVGFSLPPCLRIVAWQCVMSGINDTSAYA